MNKNYITNPEYFGYFDDPSQKEPAYDPIKIAPCLLCEKKLKDDDVRTITFLRLDKIGNLGEICYFYRVHKSCHERLSYDERSKFEEEIYDSTETN